MNKDFSLNQGNQLLKQVAEKHGKRKSLFLKINRKLSMGKNIYLLFYYLN